MTNNAAFDASIPVLTEVFEDQPVREAAPAIEATAPAQEEADAEVEARAVDNWAGPEWDLMERRLCERILHQLQGRVDVVLEQRVRDSMEEALRQAMAGLTDEIRCSVQDTIETIVARAVAQELTHLQTPKK